jgi:hypothetical protein
MIDVGPAAAHTSRIKRFYCKVTNDKIMLAMFMEVRILWL